MTLKLGSGRKKVQGPNNDTGIWGFVPDVPGIKPDYDVPQRRKRTVTPAEAKERMALMPWTHLKAHLPLGRAAIRAQEKVVAKRKFLAANPERMRKRVSDPVQTVYKFKKYTAIAATVLAGTFVVGEAANTAIDNFKGSGNSGSTFDQAAKPNDKNAPGSGPTSLMIAQTIRVGNIKCKGAPEQVVPDTTRPATSRNYFAVAEQQIQEPYSKIPTDQEADELFNKMAKAYEGFPVQQSGAAWIATNCVNLEQG